MPSVTASGSVAQDQSDGNVTLTTISTVGTYQLALDVNDLANGEVAIGQIKGIIRDAADTIRLLYQGSFANAQGIPGKLSIPVVIAHTRGHTFHLEISGEVSDVNSGLRWIVSASGTSEYYVELIGGGDPSISPEPNHVYEDGSAMTNGTLGSLAAGEWDYGDNDTLGFSTIYVRLADSADPDSKADGFVGHSYDVTVLWAVYSL